MGDESMTDLGVAGKVQAAMEKADYDGVLAVGAGNVQYLCGAQLPFLPYRYDQRLMVLWPRTGAPLCICPVEWESTVRHLGRLEDIHTYRPTGDDPQGAALAVAQSVRNALGPTATIGIDMDSVACDLAQALKQALPAAMLLACDSWLRDLRMVKTTGEIELLEEIAYVTDHAINGSLHHVIVAYPRTQMTEAEEIRVHCLERGLVETGYHSVAQVAAGPAAQRLWPLCPTHGFNYGYSPTPRLEAGQMVRVGMQATLHGYWSDATRLVVMGKATPEQKAAYTSLVTLRQALVEHLAPGARCDELYRVALDTAANRSIELVRELGVGHGIGITAYEPPYLVAGNDTDLRVGMVLVLDPVILGPAGEMLQSKDTVVVTDAGCRIVGWWKDWREPYSPIEII